MRENYLRVLFIIALSLTPVFLASHLVRAEVDEFNPTNHQPATLVLGQPNFTTTVAATSQNGMFSPLGVTVDPTTGKVFVSEQINSRVLRFASLASLDDGLAAEAVLGQADFISGSANRGGGVAANTLSNPVGMSVDSGGRLWVADAGNHRVLRYDNASTKANGADADSVLGQPNMNSSVSATTQSGMNSPAPRKTYSTKNG